ncbi:MAG: GNAT family N-acetyltransferase [Planctomycetaceae bacterium]
MQIRHATIDDVSLIVSMLAADKLGQKRESPGLPLAECYETAFAEIDANPNQELLVAEADGMLVGVLQLSFVRTLTYRGGLRAQIEGVRVHEDWRSRGLGKQLIEHAIETAKQRDAQLVELTTDKARPDALRFYESLEFVASHVGMKRQLKPTN